MLLIFQGFPAPVYSARAPGDAPVFVLAPKVDQVLFFD